jgi:hypothetical protein
MEDGEPTGEKFEYIEGYQELETRNGKPISGYIKEKGQFSKHFYTDGARTLTVVEAPYSRDTLGIIKYSKDTATMFAPNGHILEKTVFTKPYDSGTIDIYSTVQGIHVGRIVFEANKLKSGYFRPEEHLQPEKQNWGMAQFSLLNDTIVVETSRKDSPLIVARKSGAQMDIPWPMDFAVFLNELEGKKSSTAYHYYQGPDANPAFKIIATLENDGEGHLNGILIRESSWGIYISKYKGGRSAVETKDNLTWKQVLEQIELWEGK